MAKDNAVATANVWQSLFFGSYKKSQGRYARQITGGALLVLVLIAAYRLTQWPSVKDFLGLNGGHWYLGIVAAVIGGFVAYRAVQLPRFADFLIAVEAEMNKVSWPAQGELIKASIVVIFVIFFLAGVLFSFDLIWKMVFGAGNAVWNNLSKIFEP